MDNENVIDFGKWTTPKSWDELTLKQFQDIERYYDGKDDNFDVRDVLNILTDHSIDEINNLPLDFVDKLLGELTWLKEAPKFGNPNNKIDLNGDKYIVNVQEKLKVGEYVAVDAVIKGDKHNYSGILAVICRKEGEIYDSKFENEVLSDRMKMWENAPVVKVMPLISFFLSCWLLSQKNIQLYSMLEEAINLTRQDIENSHKNGDLSRHSMKSLMKKLKKLQKSIKST